MYIASPNSFYFIALRTRLSSATCKSKFDNSIESFCKTKPCNLPTNSLSDRAIFSKSTPESINFTDFINSSSKKLFDECSESKESYSEEEFEDDLSDDPMFESENRSCGTIEEESSISEDSSSYEFPLTRRRATANNVNSSPRNHPSDIVVSPPTPEPAPVALESFQDASASNHILDTCETVGTTIAGGCKATSSFVCEPLIFSSNISDVNTNNAKNAESKYIDILINYKEKSLQCDNKLTSSINKKLLTESSTNNISIDRGTDSVDYSKKGVRTVSPSFKLNNINVLSKQSSDPCKTFSFRHLREKTFPFGSRTKLSSDNLPGKDFYTSFRERTNGHGAVLNHFSKNRKVFSETSEQAATARSLNSGITRE